MINVLCVLFGMALMWAICRYHSVWVSRRQPVYKDQDTGQWKMVTMVDLEGGRVRSHGDGG